ncbi:MAG: hypothetical protein GY761_03870 [Hyphomicrobiales bacterium]|nr:hypothetical protein [Hyphomicrobiales bacterium]
MMGAQDWMALVMLGFMFGILGQFIRHSLGMRKLKQEYAGNKAAYDAAFEPGRMWLSLATGGVAGSLTALGFAGLGETNAVDFYKAFQEEKIPASFVLGLIAAGYSGSDVIDGFIRTKIKPSSTD